MKLLGTRYATFLATIGGETCVVKSQDFAPLELLPVKCHRELLGHMLGRRLGLPVPPVRLLVDDVLGRISAQKFLGDARRLRPENFSELMMSVTGFRILLLDLLIANSDRRGDNLLSLGELVIPVDYNVAFAMETSGDRKQIFDPIVMRWFGIEGALRLGPSNWEQLRLEAMRAGALLSEEYLRYAVSQLRAPFIEAEESDQLEHRLLTRRARLLSDLDAWYSETVQPIVRMLQGA